jgi:adenylosuccinate synthase
MQNTKPPKVFIVGGLLFGDEGKGTTTEFLVKSADAKLVVRYNGGHQAAHHVVIENSENFHCFSQFGSGSFFECHTLLSKYMVISPHHLLREAEKLKNLHNMSNIYKRLHIDSDCYIVTPYHQMINRIKETLRGDGRHGSTGLGVGVCIDEIFQSDSNFFPINLNYSDNNELSNVKITTLQIKDLLNMNIKVIIDKIISEKIELTKYLIYEFNSNNKLTENEKKVILNEAHKILYECLGNYTSSNLVKFYKDFINNYEIDYCNGEELIKNHLELNTNIVFEGAQGALLDRVYGFYPHTTKSICSDLFALEILNKIKEQYKINFDVIKIGVLRAYSSRHGHGPFLTNQGLIQEEHNKTSMWQGEFRTGPFDLVAAKYGIQIFQPDYLSITCLDKLLKVDCEKANICTNYIFQGDTNSTHYKRLFSSESNKIYGINKVSINEAYCNQELTNLLQNCIPYYEEINLSQDKNISNNKFDNFLKYLEEKLEKEILLISMGPTHKDKIILNNKLIE